MRKRVTTCLLSFLMLVMAVLTCLTPHMKVQAAGKTLIVHYGGRSDNSYEGWNLWIWEEGRDGQQVSFTESDSFGQIAVYQTNRTPASIGFIVRLNQWEDKDVAEDRFVAMDGDIVEIWITSGEAEVAAEAPEGAESFDFAALEQARLDMYKEEDAMKLDVHYYNFEQSYSADTVEAYAWPGDTVGGSYPYVETDDFGALFQIGMKPEEGVTTAGLKVLQNGNADTAVEYQVDLTKAVDNKLDVYLVEGNPNLWYAVNEVVYNPVIASAAFTETSSQDIQISVSKPIDVTAADAAGKFVVTDEEGAVYPVTLVESVTDKDIVLKMEQPLELSRAYRVDLEDYEGCQIAMDKIIGSDYFDEQLAYAGDDLGAVYTKEKTVFRVWAPTASEVSLNLYEEGNGDNLMETLPMQADVKGTWVCEKEGDLNGVYYTYSVKIGNKVNEAVDLYARTTGVNGDRGMVIDLDSTDPEGFSEDVRPQFTNATDAVIYELHMRDLSSDASSGIQNTGKFLGLTEKGTTNSDGLATGLDYMIDLGVTHVQLLPSYDYATVDESKMDSDQFNWGYDPKNYNVPEGSYSTDPFHGEVRVKEMKEMIQTLHENGIRVNMDVVYNHTYNVESSWFQKTVPDYYYRKNGEKYSNGSGCGNETASERAMVRKYMVDSVTYWASEYHIDGFRFDLMAVHDKETMKAIREALDKIDPSIMMYGEGWTGGETVLPASKQSLKSSIYQFDRIGAFSDDIRDGIKGNVFDSLDKGFVNGKEGMEETIKFGIVGGVHHPQVMTSENVKANGSWSGQPGQSINYVSCHDNLTLWDKLAISNADDSEEDRRRMNKLSSAIILTSQGVPFFQAGEEMLRSKPSATVEGGFDENSYCSPDSTNSLKWDNLANVKEVYDYYKGLIAFRKAHGALRMTEASDVQTKLVFMSGLDANVVAYTIEGSPNGETADKLAVIFNANKEAVNVPLPAGEWDICVNGEKAGCASLGTAVDNVSVEGISAMVLVQGDETIEKEEAAVAETTSQAGEQKTEKGGIVSAVLAVLAAGAAAVAGVTVYRKKKGSSKKYKKHL